MAHILLRQRPTTSLETPPQSALRPISREFSDAQRLGVAVLRQALTDASMRTSMRYYAARADRAQRFLVEAGDDMQFWCAAAGVSWQEVQACAVRVLGRLNGAG